MGCCATTGWPSFIVTRTSFSMFLFQGLAGFWFLHFLTGGPFTTPFSRLFPFWAEQRGNNLSLQKRLETHTPRGFSHTHTHTRKSRGVLIHHSHRMNSTEFRFMIEFIFMSLPSGSSLLGPEIYSLPSHVLQFAINKLKIKNIRQTQVITKASSSFGQTTIFHKTEVGRWAPINQNRACKN